MPRHAATVQGIALEGPRTGVEQFSPDRKGAGGQPLQLAEAGLQGRMTGPRQQRDAFPRVGRGQPGGQQLPLLPEHLPAGEHFRPLGGQLGLQFRPLPLEFGGQFPLPGDDGLQGGQLASQPRVLGAEQVQEGLLHAREEGLFSPNGGKTGAGPRSAWCPACPTVPGATAGSSSSAAACGGPTLLDKPAVAPVPGVRCLIGQRNFAGIAHGAWLPARTSSGDAAAANAAAAGDAPRRTAPMRTGWSKSVHKGRPRRRNSMRCVFSQIVMGSA